VPVAGLPDPDVHWRCVRCGQWFEADEGSLFERQRSSRAGAIADAIRGEVKLLFRCDPCTAKHKRNRIIFYGVLALLFVVGLLVQRAQE
jgi:hypothetical protein